MQNENESSGLIIDDLRSLLLNGANATQETICKELEARGHRVNQSKVSRLLRKINAIKFKNDQGEMVYHLSHDARPPSVSTSVAELIVEIVANEALIMIKTTPGAASLIARILDHKKCQILGTVAGDDTIFVAPESVKRIGESLALIQESLLGA